MTTTYPRLSFSSARPVILPYLIANKAVLLIGSPGVGKTTLGHELAPELTSALGFEMKAVTVIGSTCDPTDIGGFPVVGEDGAFDRIPMRVIREAAEAPCLLILDELFTAPPAVQAVLLRGILERTFGDVTLHPETRVIAFANPVEQSPGGTEPCAPLMGRFSVYTFEPTLGEFQGYLNKLGADDSPLRAWAQDFAATAEHQPDMVQFDPPSAAVNEGAKWASPRDWERGFLALAQAGKVSDEVAHLILAGAVGEYGAASYMGIRELRIHLPTISEIIADPEGARVPDNAMYQVGALGLLANVADKDCWASWIYASRLRDEISASAAKALMSRRQHGAKRLQKKGKNAMVKLLGKAGNAMGL